VIPEPYAEQPEPESLSILDATAPESPSSLTQRLVRGTLGTGGLNVFYTGLLFVTTAVLTRALGASSYGVYAQVAAVVALVGVAATPGIERLLIRDMAVYEAHGQHQLARGLMLATNATVLALSLLLGILAGLVTWLINDQEVTPVVIAFWVGYTIIPLNALSRTRMATIMGLRRMVGAQFPELVVRPVLFLVLVLAAQFGLRPFTPVDALILTALSAAAAFLVGAYVLHRITPLQVRRARPAYDLKRWRLSAGPLFLLSAASMVNVQVGIALMGSLSTSANAGLFAVASRGAGIIALGVTSTITALAPSAARLWSQGDVEQLQRVVSRCSQMTSLYAVPVALGLIVFGQYFLAIFGSEFVAAMPALRILCVGQLVMSATGPVTYLLLMAGEERHAMLATVYGAVINVVLDVALIPHWGVEGAAVATTVGLMAAELLMLRYARKALGVRLTLFGHLRSVT
jgi:O-antigen/teichoic acid export membrane protein